MSKNYNIIHLSDLHYSFPKLHAADLRSKRFLGLINEILIKKSYHYNHQREQLFKNIAEKEWDLLCITGDFSNLSCRKEFQKASQQLEHYFGDRKIVVLAGNHDRYTKRVTRKEYFEYYFEKHIVFNWEKRQVHSVHVKEVLDNFLLVFFDMAVPRPWYSSRGTLTPNFFKEYQQKIRNSKNRKKKKIGFGHYPLFIPTGTKDRFWRRLNHGKKLASYILEDSFLAYCHGHIHSSWQEMIQIQKNSIWSLNSGGVVLGRKKHNQFYNRIILYSNGVIKITPLFY